MIAKIAIASTLKPVIDPRAFEKIGKSLAGSGNYTVHVLGSLPTSDVAIANLIVYPIVHNLKSSLDRLSIPWLIFNKLKIIRPDLLIITTHELLLIGALIKILTGCKLIYDVQENYFFNLLYQTNYGWGVRQLLAFYIRTKELFLAHFCDHFLLAEKCYAEEISFVTKRNTVLENTFKAPDFVIEKADQKQVEFLISGTISREFGIFEALRFFKQLQSRDYRLVIIGHCPNRKTLREIHHDVKQLDNVDLVISHKPIPHHNILAKIGSKTIALLPYQTNKSTQNKIPTKLYEYIGLGVPVLISANPKWDTLVNKYRAGVSFNFLDPPINFNFSSCIALNNDRQSIDLKDIMWKNEEITLLTLMESVLSKR